MAAFRRGDREWGEEMVMSTTTAKPQRQEN
jgi:hypothetical protein